MTNEHEDERALSKAEAAQMLGCSVASLERWEKEGILPKRRRLSSARVFFLRSELVEFLRSREVGVLTERTAGACAANRRGAEAA